jgi:hypothetical protein
MTDVNKGLADILTEYSNAMSRIERAAPTADVSETPYGETILKPADRQRGWRPPTIGDAAKA